MSLSSGVPNVIRRGKTANRSFGAIVRTITRTIKPNDYFFHLIYLTQHEYRNGNNRYGRTARAEQYDSPCKHFKHSFSPSSY
jgi:hypothetical protein